MFAPPIDRINTKGINQTQHAAAAAVLVNVAVSKLMMPTACL